MVPIRLTHLPPYPNATIKGADIFPVSSTDNNNFTSTFRVSGQQLVDFITAAVVTQNPFGESNINFGSVTTDGLVFNGVAITGDIATKIAVEINHTGSPASTVYTITHSITSENVNMQLLEKTTISPGVVQLSVVLASLTHTTDGETGTATVSILNPESATYKLVVIS